MVNQFLFEFGPENEKIEYKAIPTGPGNAQKGSKTPDSEVSMRN